MNWPFTESRRGEMEVPVLETEHNPTPNSPCILLWDGKLTPMPASEPVTEFGVQAEILAELLFAMLRKHKGAGLAAMQVGKFQRMFVVELMPEQPDSGGEYRKLVFIYPVFKGTQRRQTYGEGCLSLPGMRAKVTRAQTVYVEYQDVSGKRCGLKAQNFLAQVIQHECDHLDGVFFPHRISSVQRDILRRKYLKYLHR